MAGFSLDSFQMKEMQCIESKACLWLEAARLSYCAVFTSSWGFSISRLPYEKLLKTWLSQSNTDVGISKEVLECREASQDSELACQSESCWVHAGVPVVLACCFSCSPTEVHEE